MFKCEDHDPASDFQHIIAAAIYLKYIGTLHKEHSFLHTTQPNNLAELLTEHVSAN